mmetsp:Transcript_5462/g.22411  ORF Transcript_5462/g.22411 Transcript_5462/m.22411 type:complete len:213 (-) Transcript_5462:735-1373(-)
MPQARHDPRGRLRVVRRRRGRPTADTRRFSFRGRDVKRRELEQARANQPSIVRGAGRSRPRERLCQRRLRDGPLVSASSPRAHPSRDVPPEHRDRRVRPRVRRRGVRPAQRRRLVEERRALGEPTGRPTNRVGAKEEEPDEVPDRGVVHAPRVGVQESLGEPEGARVGARRRRRGFEPSLRGGRVAESEEELGVRSRHGGEKLGRRGRRSVP